MHQLKRTRCVVWRTAGLVQAADVERMDKSALRAALGAWGLPTSGKVELLRQRLNIKLANPNE